MNFLRRLLGMFGSSSRSAGRYLDIYVLSRRCNEPLMGQVDLVNELSRVDEGDATYYTRKVLHTTGERRCFAQVEVELYFDQSKKILRHEVTDGRWLSAEEYQAELERFHAPPPEEEEEGAEAVPAAEASVPTGTTTSTQAASDQIPPDQTPSDQAEGSE